METDIKLWKIEFREDDQGYIGEIIHTTWNKHYPYSTSKIATHILISGIEYTIGIIRDDLDQCIRIITLHKNY